jgi:malonyl-CoA decarboxylase
MDENFLSLSTEAQTRLVAAYLTSRKDGRAVVDPVANFHLSNGAALWRINPAADESETGKNQSHGFMVNYMYDQQTLAANAESYADDAEITYSEHVLPFLFTKS